MSSLSAIIQDLYEDISEQEAALAADSLVILFKTLQGVERRLAHEKCSELSDENIRNTN